jgi:hypothetical protein
MLISHFRLQILCPIYFLALNLGLEIVAIHPISVSQYPDIGGWQLRFQMIFCA